MIPQYLSERLRHKIELVLLDGAVHNFSKEIIKRGLQLDCVDAYFDVQLSAEILKEVMEELTS